MADFQTLWLDSVHRMQTLAWRFFMDSHRGAETAWFNLQICQIIGQFDRAQSGNVASLFTDLGLLGGGARK